MELFCLEDKRISSKQSRKRPANQEFYIGQKEPSGRKAKYIFQTNSN